MVLVDIGEETDTGVEALLEALRRHVRIERSNVLTFHADEEEESDSGTPSEQGGSASGEANRASRVGLTVALPIPFPSTRG